MPSSAMEQCAKNPMEVFKDMFICMIDFEPLNHPKLLQCGHSFCRNCLIQLLLSQRRSSRDLLSEDEATDRIRCPVCSSFTVVPDDGVDGLSNNFMLEKLKDCVRELEGQRVGTEWQTSTGASSVAAPAAEAETKVCEMSAACKAKAEPAQYRCHECSMNCCLRCHEKHNKNLSYHKTVSLSSDTATLLNCPSHDGEYIRFYCIDCKVSLCTFCRVHEDHDTSHSIVEIMDKDSIIQERQYIKKHVAEVKDTLKYVTALSNKLQNLRQTLYEMYAKCEDELQAAFANLLQEIQRTWAAFETERQASKMSTEKILDTAQEEINYHVTNCTSLVGFIDRLLGNKESFQPLTLFRDLKARMTAAAKNVPTLDQLLPDIHVAHFESQNPSDLSFGHIEDKPMRPTYQGNKVELHHIPEEKQKKKRESHSGGQFIPEDQSDLETIWKAPERLRTKPSVTSTPKGKSVFYDDGGGIFLAEDHFPAPKPGAPPMLVFPREPVFSRADATRWSEVSSTDSDRLESAPASPVLRPRGSFAYASGPVDFQSGFRRCVSNLSLPTPKMHERYSSKEAGRDKQGGSDWQRGKMSILKKLKLKLQTPSSSKKEKPKSEKDKKVKKRQKSSSSSLLSLPDPHFATLEGTEEGERLWQMTCGNATRGCAICYPSDIAISPNTEEVFVSDHMQKVICVVEKGKLKRAFRPQLLPTFTPWGVAASNSGHVYCTDIDNRCVHVFTWQGDHLTSWKSPEDHTPFGITTTQNGSYIVVTSACQQAPPSNIIVSTYNTEGKLVHSHRCNYGGGPGELKDPRYIVADDQSMVYTSDGDTGRINMYGMSGNYQGHFSRLLGRPAGICYGLVNDILVADRGANNRIARFTTSGKYLGDMKTKCTEEITWPQGMSSCRTNDHMLLAITEYLENSKVTISLYKFFRHSVI